MVNFHEGPAAGATLMLRRKPLPRFLRVVINPDGEIDALDLHGDKADELEAIHVYVRFGSQGWCHLNTRGKPGGGIFSMGEYRFHSTPADELVREDSAWQRWAVAALEEIEILPEC